MIIRGRSARRSIPTTTFKKNKKKGIMKMNHLRCPVD